MYKIHITFTDGTWRLDSYDSESALYVAVSHETREMLQGRTKIFAVYIQR